MMAYFNSPSISLVKHTNFHSPDMEDEYGFYIDRYYKKQLSRSSINTFGEQEDDDEISNSDETLVDSDDELEVTVTNHDPSGNNIIINVNDNVDNNVDNDDPGPRTTIPIPFDTSARTELQINDNPDDYLIFPSGSNVNSEGVQNSVEHNDLNHAELMTEHHEIMERVVSTFNELSQRLTSITSAPNLATINDNDSGSSMSISEPSDNAYERDDSVVIGPTIENVEQCEEENSDDNSSIETDPDVNIISRNLYSQSVNNELKGKYIVRAMTGSRETGYEIEVHETFYTAEVANHFYESIALLHYNLKEIEFIPFELIINDETPDPRNILNSEEKIYDSSKYTSANATEMFVCEECKLQCMINKCYVCNRQNICNYCNGENVWCKQNEDWMCRDCHNNRQQEECIEQEEEDEEEIVSSSLMTYGVPANADIHPSEYIRNRIEEITRDSYLDKGFTEEDYEEMQQMRLEEYGSDGDY